ncbi:hypothetical protein [Olsenella sp. HMSC062G07]|uniref:hypothetical protein n=1 Tax=Olsenella sp. HMSC062G07 TaxID=1739330 RepID=UPI0008D54DE3|nr:hypothetical protein [Olsenella sp. HMSC062G07]OFK23323.1 hypothetical protein HMPREF2826_05285 [Olsenella sp. HMSC062G07]
MARNMGRQGRRPSDGNAPYVPSTRVGRDDPRRTSIGSQSRGGRGSRAIGPQRRNSKYRSDQNYRTITGRDTGYSLRGRSQQINFDGRRRDLLARYGISNRMLVLAAAALVLVLILILGVSSCVRGCTAKQAATGNDDQASTNQWDARVAVGASQELTGKFSPALDRGEKLAAIAKSADQYPDPRIPELAVNEPEAVDFVSAYATAEHKPTDYGQPNDKGSFPLLYDWDVRWGYVDYAGSVMGVTGSGPTSLAMAYMGLTGKTDKTPAAFAADAQDKGYGTTDDASTTGDLFTYEATQLGLGCKAYTSPSAETLEDILSVKGAVAIVGLKAGFDGPYAHWALVVRKNDDGSVTLHDPTSAAASGHSWSVGTVAANATSFYALSGDSTSGSSDAAKD